MAEEPGIRTTPPRGRRLHGVALFSVLAALLYILFLEALDNTAIGPALPRIIDQFQGLDRYSWVITVYLLTSTTVIPIAGKLSDQFGRKGFLLTGAGIFLLGSVLTGAAQTMNQLIAFRALQGLGAGMGMTLVATIIGDIFPPEERAKWQTSVNIVYAVANLLGPGLGGWLTDHGPLLGAVITEESRWRWIFYLNLPFGLIAVVFILIFLPATISDRSSQLTGWAAARRIDVSGALLCTVATICLLLALTWGSDQTYAWASPQVVGLFTATGIFVLLLLLAERRAVEPLLPLSFFRSQTFVADAALSLLVYMILLGLAIYLPLFLQEILGISATNTGIAITPFLLSVTGGATLSGLLITWRKRYRTIVIVGTSIMTLGVFFLTRITPNTTLLEAVIYLVIAALGIGSMFSVLYVAAQNVLPTTQLGVGSAVIRYLGQLGSTLGVAIIGTVVNQSLPTNLLKQLSNPAVAQTAGADDALKQALAFALQRGFIAVLVFCGIAIIAACFLKDVPMGQQARKAPDQPAEVPAQSMAPTSREDS
jgi:EmrB/QacA subfamily drug resistance transporter